MTSQTKHRTWWLAVGTAAAVGAGLLVFAVLARKDLGDYATVVQAVVAMVLAFATVASIVRSDAQIEKTQLQIDEARRAEVRHLLFVQADLDGHLTFSNLGKYPVLIETAVVASRRGSSRIALVDNVVILAGSQHVTTTSIIEKLGVSWEIGEFLSKGWPLDPERYLESDPLARYEVCVFYRYGGTGARQYIKMYGLGTDVATALSNMVDRAFLVSLTLSSFHYWEHGRGSVDIPLELESEIPDRPTEPRKPVVRIG